MSLTNHQDNLLQENILVYKTIDQIEQYIQICDKTNATTTLHEILLKQKTDQLTGEYTKNLGIYICSMCTKILASLSLSLTDVLKDSQIQRILESKSLDELMRILTQVIDCVISCLSSYQMQDNYIISKAKIY